MLGNDNKHKGLTAYRLNGKLLGMILKQKRKIRDAEDKDVPKLVYRLDSLFKRQEIVKKYLYK